MEKFSYALEFYRENLYSLDNVNFFEKKVKEAEKIENYFSKLIPNIEYIRPYILMSYRFEKILGYENRIRYIRGLVYASDYIDFYDAYNIPKDLDYFTEIGLCNLDLTKQSLWGYTSYIYSSNTDEALLDIISPLDNKENEEDVDDMSIIPNEDNVHELKKEEFDGLTKLINEVMNSSDNVDDIKDETKEDDEEVDEYITIEEKLSRFKKNSEIYIEKILEKKLKEKVIKKEDIPMIKRGMKRWFKKVFYIIERVIEFDDKEYEYKDKNIVRFL